MKVEITISKRFQKKVHQALVNHGFMINRNVIEGFDSKELVIQNLVKAFIQDHLNESTDKSCDPDVELMMEEDAQTAMADSVAELQKRGFISRPKG